MRRQTYLRQRLRHMTLMSVLLALVCVVFACESEAPRRLAPVDKSVQPVIGGTQNRMLPSIGAIVTSGQSFCTGSLIAKRVVLTAAHCIDSARSKSNLGYRIEVPDSSAQGYQFITYAADISLLSAHPQWNRNVAQGNDIGFVILKNPVDPAHATPIAWNENNPIDSSYVGQNVQFLGYGLIQSVPSAVRATVKMGALIPIESVQSDRIVTRGQGKSICHGDSGGPALFQMGGVWTVIGVNSYVTGPSATSTRSACRGTGVPMRTDSYKTYINSILSQYGDPGCTKDTDCPSGQKCDVPNGKCVPDPCGNGVCDTASGENCSTCAKDCGCTTEQVCTNGTCQAKVQCGDGRCDAAQNENCGNCPGDCPCGAGQVCQNAQCVAQNPCGNGVCEANIGENCGTCAQDCTCPADRVCQNNACQVKNPCGNGVCEPNIGENCGTCAQDCTCPTGLTCLNNACSTPPQTGCTTNDQCQGGLICQNGQCVTPPQTGCTTNDQCQSGLICQNGQCVAPPQTGCVQPTDCPAGQTCQKGQCVTNNQPPNTLPQGTKGGPCSQSGKCNDGLRCYVDAQSNSICLPSTTPASSQVCPLYQRATSCDPTGKNCVAICLSAQGAGCQLLPARRALGQLWLLLLLLPVLICRRGGRSGERSVG